jgi:hypothetical protein
MDFYTRRGRVSSQPSARNGHPGAVKNEPSNGLSGAAGGHRRGPVLPGHRDNRERERKKRRRENQKASHGFEVVGNMGKFSETGASSRVTANSILDDVRTERRRETRAAVAAAASAQTQSKTTAKQGDEEAELSQVKRLDFDDIQTPATISIVGGSKTGKSTVIMAFTAALAPRFDMIISFSPTPVMRGILAGLSHKHFVFSEFRPDLMKALAIVCQKSIDELGIKPSLLLILDDLFTEDGVSRHPLWKMIYKRAHHFGWTLLESKHDVFDTGAGNRESLHVVAVMGRAKPKIRKNTFEQFFSDSFDSDSSLFEKTLNEATLKRKGACLIYNSTSDRAPLSFLRSKQTELLRPFAIGNPDLFILMHKYATAKPQIVDNPSTAPPVRDADGKRRNIIMSAKENAHINRQMLAHEKAKKSGKPIAADNYDPLKKSQFSRVALVMDEFDDEDKEHVAKQNEK